MKDLPHDDALEQFSASSEGLDDPRTGNAVLAQIVTDAKSNEVTADALNCQRAIAQQIVEQGGDYALALKGNQGTLDEDVVRLLDDPASTFTTAKADVDADHGRMGQRQPHPSVGDFPTCDCPALRLCRERAC